MADEPNTNPDSGEGEKPAPKEKSASQSTKAASRRSSTRASSSKSSTRQSQSAKKEKPRRPAATSALEDSYTGFSAELQRMQGDLAKEHQALLDKVNGDIEKLKSDVASSDPSKAFIKDLTDGVAKGDPRAVAEAYSTLLRHTVQRQSAAEKRLLDIIASYYKGVNALSEGAQKNFLAGAKDYSDSVAGALSESKLSELKPADQTLAAHALLMGALVQSMSQRV